MRLGKAGGIVGRHGLHRGLSQRVPLRRGGATLYSRQRALRCKRNKIQLGPDFNGQSSLNLHVGIGASLSKAAGGNIIASQAPGGSFDIGRVIGRGFQTLGRQALIFIALSLILVGLPTFATQTIMMDGVRPGNVQLFLSPVYWLTVFLGMVSGFLLQGAVVHASLRDLRGEEVDFGQALLVALKLLLPMIGLTILISFLAMIGFVLLIVPGVIVYIMLIVAVPVLVEEKRGVFGSMARSRQLTKGSRWWILLLIILYLIAAAVLGGVTGGLILLVGPVLVGVIQALLGAALGLLSATMLTSLYIELRSIREGAGESTLAAIFA